jgi:Protein of unknown function (DUF3313)
MPQIDQGQSIMRFVRLASVCLLLAACSNEPKVTAGLGAEMPLKPADGDLIGGTLVYRAPDIDPRAYRGIYVAPAAIYDGTDAEWGGMDSAARQRVAARLTREAVRALRASGRQVLGAPTANSVTFQMTLASIASTHGVAANVLKVTPIGLGLTLAKSAAGLPASFTGSITVAGKLTESSSGKPLAGFVAKVSPVALDPRTLGGTEDTAMLAAEKGADEFSAAVSKAMGGQ